MPDTRTIVLEVMRYDSEHDAEPRFQSYEIPYTDDMSVLQGLQYVKDHLDGTLTYRWSCRMGVCGSCGMMVNGQPRLTCSAFLRDYYPNPVRVEPLAHFPVLRKALGTLAPEELRLDSRDAVFDTFLKLHPRLKEHYFLNTKEEDADPYESSQFTVLIANASGIYDVYSYREVFEFDRFWAIGSGRAFALGAMYAGFDRLKTAKDGAELGVRAGCEFDKNSDEPVRVNTLKVME